MGRIHFYHTVWRKHPDTGLVEPLEDVVATAYEVDGSGAEGDEAVVFSSRTGVSAGGMVSDEEGEIEFWLDNGDYNVHLVDSTLPSRMADKIIGVSSVPGGPAQIAAWQLPTGLALVPPGGVIPYAGTIAPTGFVMCDGAAISRSTYADLYDAIGTAFGAGDGSSTFNVPDMRGRMPLGADPTNLRTTDQNDIGLAGGEEKHTLIASEEAEHSHGAGDMVTSAIGAHTHGNTGMENSSLAHVHNFGAGYAVPRAGGGSGWMQLTSNIFDDAFDDVGGFRIPTIQLPSPVVSGLSAVSSSGPPPHTHGTAAAGGHQHTISGETDNAGGGDPHNNMPPTLCMNYIIKT